MHTIVIQPLLCLIVARAPATPKLSTYKYSNICKYSNINSNISSLNFAKPKFIFFHQNISCILLKYHDRICCPDYLAPNIIFKYPVQISGLNISSKNHLQLSYIYRHCYSRMGKFRRTHQTAGDKLEETDKSEKIFSCKVVILGY